MPATKSAKPAGTGKRQSSNISASTAREQEQQARTLTAEPVSERVADPLAEECEQLRPSVHDGLSKMQVLGNQNVEAAQVAATTQAVVGVSDDADAETVEEGEPPSTAPMPATKSAKSAGTGKRQSSNISAQVAATTQAVVGVSDDADAETVEEGEPPSTAPMPATKSAKPAGTGKRQSSNISALAGNLNLNREMIRNAKAPSSRPALKSLTNSDTGLVHVAASRA
eukprot:COSAG01_NODE_9280_length_2495_cov_482.247078_3_plen_225_part_01